MGFQKGHPQFNTGKTYFKKGEKASNWNGFVKEDKPVHTGKTKKEFPALSNSGVKKGNIPWNKDKKLSKEHREKAIKNLVHGKGEKNNAWKGGVSTKNERVRGSSNLKNWKRIVFKRDNYACQISGKRGEVLNAHHIKPFSDYPELRTKISNGITLSEEWHNLIKGYEKDWESYFNFNLETRFLESQYNHF